MSTTSPRDPSLHHTLKQYSFTLNKNLKQEVEKIIRQDNRYLEVFLAGSADKELMMKCLMEFAAETANIEEFVDFVGDLTTNLPDLHALDSTIGNILESEQFKGFVGRFLEVFRGNVRKGVGENGALAGEGLVGEISQTVADYVTELAVDFVWDSVMNGEAQDP